MKINYYKINNLCFNELGDFMHKEKYLEHNHQRFQNTMSYYIINKLNKIDAGRYPDEGIKLKHIVF